MSEDDKPQQATRRAKRRAEQSHEAQDSSDAQPDPAREAEDPEAQHTATSDETSERAESEGHDAAQPAAEDKAGAEEQATPEGEAKDEAGLGATGAGTARPRKKKKKKKRAVAAQEGEPIRDRNRRLREEAAARRRKKREQDQRSVAAHGLDPSEMVDDALARTTQRVVAWLKRHFNVVQWVIVILLVGGIAWRIYDWRSERANEETSDVLMAGINSELAPVGESDVGPDVLGIKPVKPRFTSPEERLKAAAEAYQKAAEVDSKTARVLANMGLAGVRYEQGKFDDAVKLYESVKVSKLAERDSDLRARAIEGIGLSFEAKGDRKSAEKAFRELENSEIFGMAPLALYHQGRLAYAAKDLPKAKELLEKAQKKAQELTSPVGPVASYVESAARELLAVVDPTAVPAAGNQQITPEQIRELQRQLSQAGSGQNPEELEALLENLRAQTGTPGPQEPQEPPTPDETPTPETPAEEAAPQKQAAEPAPKPAPAAEPAPKPAPAAEKPAAEKPPEPAPAPEPEKAPEPAVETE